MAAEISWMHNEQKDNSVNLTHIEHTEVERGNENKRAIFLMRMSDWTAKWEERQKDKRY